MTSIALICAVELECAPLLSRLHGAEPLRVSRLAGWAGTLGDRRVMVFLSGITKANAAHAATVVVERLSVSHILNFGVAGAYPGGGLDVGDLVLADSETYGDEGVEAPEGWISCEKMGFPLADLPHGKYFETFPVHGGSLRRAKAALDAAGLHPWVGPFATVSTCSGTDRRGRELRLRHGALCESMEGAAIAHVSAMYDIPFVEVRAISNLVEDRNLSNWDLAGAAEKAAHAAAVIAAAL